jgi:hypothetical protein
MSIFGITIVYSENQTLHNITVMTEEKNPLFSFSAVQLKFWPYQRLSAISLSSYLKIYGAMSSL